jgi:hypothetical protein
MPRKDLEQLAVDDIASGDGNYGIKEAVKGADGYEFPQERADIDLKLFRASALDFTTRGWSAVGDSCRTAPIRQPGTSPFLQSRKGNEGSAT